MIVHPKNVEARSLQDVRQCFFAQNPVAVVVAAADAAHHARQGNVGGRAASLHQREVDDVALGKLRIGFAVVTGKLPIGRTRCFTHNDHKERRTFGLDHALRIRIDHQMHAGTVGTRVSRERSHKRVDHNRRHDLIAKRLVGTHRSGEGLEVQKHHAERRSNEDGHETDAFGRAPEHLTSKKTGNRDTGSSLGDKTQRDPEQRRPRTEKDGKSTRAQISQSLMRIGCQEIANHVGRIGDAVKISARKTDGADGGQHHEYRTKHLGRQPRKHFKQRHGKQPEGHGRADEKTHLGPRQHLGQTHQPCVHGTVVYERPPDRRKDNASRLAHERTIGL